MTPREKATEILKKVIGHNNIPCAIMVASEAINVLEKLYNDLAVKDEKALFKIKWEIIWWRDVRKEIEKS